MKDRKQTLRENLYPYKFGSDKPVKLDILEEDFDSEEFFGKLLDEGYHHSASVYAEAADLEPRTINRSMDKRLDRILRSNISPEDLKEAFSLLDSFNYEKTVEDLYEGQETDYIGDSSERVIDRVATDLWSELDGSAKAFFQMYTENAADFEEQSIAEVYHKGWPRGQGSYKNDALKAYNSLREAGQDQDALNVLRRFELPDLDNLAERLEDSEI